MDRRILRLNTADLGPFNLRRDFTHADNDMNEGYISDYDRTTLWYDAFWVEGVVYLVCPSLRNLRKHMRKATYLLDGRKCSSIKITANKRHDVIEIVSPDCPAGITVESDEFSLSTIVSSSEASRFKGLNSHFTLNKDNDLEWIYDFFRYHVESQNLQVSILYDNNSTKYSVEDIRAVLSKTGLKDFIIVSVPQPYGRRSLSGGHRAKFLHNALMNIARLRFLRSSRAVLNADIDELVWTDQDTIFDKTVTSKVRFVSIAGERRYPSQDHNGARRHKEHVFKRISTPRRFTTKYCIAPTGAMKGVSWDVHRLEQHPMTKYLDSTTGFYHCHRVSTNWKQRLRKKSPSIKWLKNALAFDPKTKQRFEKVFEDVPGDGASQTD